ncbi:hypothetical protein [Rathayibacter sp. AY1D9]|uniref:hypothetical protein n=1 Tax=Rathayibacter sp. AY1D9 TaxID=2080548 RepID=UPI0011B08C27|nr:hypothetical protein [Rathayibacter sp. AY1D9]
MTPMDGSGPASGESVRADGFRTSAASGRRGDFDRDGETSILLDAVAVMANWRRRSPFRCRAFRRTPERTETYRLEVRPVEASFSCVDERTGTVDAYDAPTGRYVSGGEERPLDRWQLLPEPLAARLAFPLNLPVWGRPSDGYRMTGASIDGALTVIRLRHQADDRVRGTMTVDPRLRLVTRFDTPTETCWYEDVEAWVEHSPIR